MRYQAYPEYKDSGVEWLGKVPKHWDVKRIKESAKLINGYPFDSTLFEPSQGIPLVRIRDINSVTTEVGYSGNVPANALINNDDILIGMDGDFNVAKWNGGKAALNQRVACVRATNPFLQKYIFYSLPFNMKVLNDLTYYTTVKHLSRVDILKTKYAYPSEIELSSIVKFLDHETAKIDTLIEKQQQLIKLLKEKRQAVISHAVTKGLNPNAPMRDSGIEWLGEVPEHWVVRRLKHTSNLQSGIPKGKDLTDKISISVPMLRVANVQDGYLDLNDVHEMAIEPEQLERYSLEYGDVLMNEGGDNDKLGRGAVWKAEITPCIHQNHVFAIRPYSIEPEWLGGCPRIENLLRKSHFGQIFHSFSFNRTTIRLK